MTCPCPLSTVFLAALQMRCKKLILCGWALQTYSAVGHCRDTWWLGSVRILCGWALQTYSAGWALQGYLVDGQCKDTLRLGTAGILGGGALQGYLVVGHES